MVLKYILSVFFGFPCTVFAKWVAILCSECRTSPSYIYLLFFFFFSATAGSSTQPPPHSHPPPFPLKRCQWAWQRTSSRRERVGHLLSPAVEARPPLNHRAPKKELERAWSRMIALHRMHRWEKLIILVIVSLHLDVKKRKERKLYST